MRKRRQSPAKRVATWSLALSWHDAFRRISLQATPSVEQTAHNGTLRDTQRRSHILVAHPLQFSHHDHGPVKWVELCKRRIQLTFYLRTLRHVEWVRVAEFWKFETTRVVHALGNAFPIHSVLQWMSPVVDCQVYDDSVQPGIETGCSSERVNARVSPQERVLYDFLCVLLVSHQRERELVRSALMANYEYVEDIGIACLHTSNQFIVGQRR